MTNITKINEHIYIDETKLLGKGSTGNVYFGGSSREPGLKYAVKAIDLSEVTNQVTQYLLSCEIVALSQLSKLNIQSIVKLHEIAFQQGFCYLAMQLLQGGSLAEYLRENPNGLNENEVQQLFRQMFQGYKAIKNQGIVHRDIKPDNIIFRYKEGPNRQGASKKLCFIDFGYCTKQSVPNRPKVYYNVGSPKYMSPQAYKKNTYSQKSDVWALGIILYEMLHGKTIDKDMDMDEYLQFMEHNQLPITRNVNDFLRNLLHGMLTFDANKRISCQTIEQILNGHNNMNQNRQFQNHFSQSKFTSIVPHLDIPTQNFNRRNSPFYRSQIITHRSDLTDNVNIHQNPNVSFDPRRQQRNFSQQSKLQEYNRSPKKIIHVEHTSQRINGMLVNVPFTSEKKNFIKSTGNIEQNNVKQIFNGFVGPVRRQLERIEQENDYEVQRQNLLKNNNMVHNFRVEPDNRRNFLRAIDQRQFHHIANINPNHPRINNPNVRLVNNGNFPIAPSTPSKVHELIRSQIFQVNQDKSFNTGNQFFSSQINQINDVHQHPNIKVITSDKAIYNHGLDRPDGELLDRNLNKSFSTQNVQIRNQNSSQLGNSRFNPAFNQNQGPLNQRPIQAIPIDNNNLRPIDFLTQNKQNSNNRAFLRNTMPNVYRSTIVEQSSHIQNQQMRQNLDNSKDMRNPNASLIENTNQSNFKNHSPYFDVNFVTPQKQMQDPHNTSNFHPDTSFSAGEKRNEKSSSFKFITHQGPHTIQRDEMRLNFFSQTPVQSNQFNQPQPLHFNQQLTPPVQINPQQIIQQPVQVNRTNHLQQNFNHTNQPNQINQPNQMFFNNQEQKSIINQNQFQNQLPNSHQQMITLQQPMRERSMDTQFKKSMIFTHNQQPNYQNLQFNQQRTNQNSPFQQPRQAVFVQKQFMSQPAQNQRPVLMSTINQNPQINRMIRPTYPFPNQQPITVTQY